MQSLIDRPTDALATGADAATAAAFSGSTSSVVLPKVTSGEYLACRLGEEEYGIEILRVQEIRSYERPTRIAGAPAHVLGVINLRGIIVPVVDLRLKFGCPAAEFGPTTVVVVLRLRETTVGAVVDAVSDVLNIEATQISPPPQLGGGTSSHGVVGIGTLNAVDGHRMLLLLDAEVTAGGADLVGCVPPARQH